MEGHREFNYVFLEAFEETLTALLGSDVLTALNATLLKDYDVSRDELPYRFDTLIVVLTQVLGVRNANTIGRSIIRKLFSKLNIEFDDLSDYAFNQYLEKAKQTLANPNTPPKPSKPADDLLQASEQSVGGKDATLPIFLIEVQC